MLNDLSLCLPCIAQASILVICANGAPVLTRNWLKQRFDWPVDLGLEWNDGRPLFGKTKTWRGLVAAILATALLAPLLGLSFHVGGQFAFWVMSGDLVGSFFKRRRGLVESSRCRMLDIIPESLFPSLMMQKALGLGPLEIAAVVCVFFVLEVLLSPILYRMGIRKRPY